MARAPAALECTLTRILRLEGSSNFLVLGEVTGIHISDEVLVDGMIDVGRYTPLARMGYRDYAAIRDVFTLKRPGE